MRRVMFRGSSGTSKKLIETKSASQKVANELDDLPDNLIHHILSFVETKDAIRTLVLSRRWRHMWASVPCLNLNSKSFSRLTDFKRFVKLVLSQRDTTSHIKALTYSHFGVDDATDDELLYNNVVEFAISHGAEEIQINLGGKNSTDQANSSNPFSNIQKHFGFAKLTTLHLNNFTLSCTGTSSLDPFAGCVNLKNLHLSELCFKSDLNPRDFVISAPQLNNLTLACNRFNCKLVIAARRLHYLSYIHSSSRLCFEFGLRSSDDLKIDVHELHNDELEIYHQGQKEETLHGFINTNVVRTHHNNVEAVELSFRTVMVTCGAASLLKFDDSFCTMMGQSLTVGDTVRYFITDHITI
ncbi:F-box/LRR-repeat protein At5g02910-like [Neltuma alba]|uniref:F-box/LRR-repeat protein At5g02910-like n=1 Tax=Neltuma alba TaxID=207710 RepID=UPI0010A32213|nr:F-box/LRR-repeat protein At5g02910-like [Prosopis alba]